MASPAGREPGPLVTLVLSRTVEKVDSIGFVGPFDEVLTSIGARVVKTPVRAPRANAFAERFVRTTRTECLDWLLIRSKRHLERVLEEFVEHYNAARPHRGIDLEVPIPYVSGWGLDDSTRIRRVDRLGGLLHEYSIAA